MVSLADLKRLRPSAAVNLAALAQPVSGDPFPVTRRFVAPTATRYIFGNRWHVIEREPGALGYVKVRCGLQVAADVERIQPMAPPDHRCPECFGTRRIADTGALL